MDKTDRVTRDFMNVESFSQLPFIRPPPPIKEKANGAIIRLFGKEFGGNNNNNNMSIDDQSDSTDDNNNNTAQIRDSNKDNGDSTEISSRKFECHYCCRNFPTSQALGGHQNAHKRERQQAKRAHLQSAIGFSDATRVYGLTNYNRLLGSDPALPMPAYQSWNNYNSSSLYSDNTRLHAGYGSYHAPQPQPINGSPLGLWRIPAAAHSSSAQQVASFNSRDDIKQLSSIGGIPSSHQLRFGYDQSKPDMQDHVSLDLHL